MVGSRSHHLAFLVLRPQGMGAVDLLQELTYARAMENNVTLDVEMSPSWTASYKRYSVWLLLGGKAVAWAVVSDDPSQDGYLCLCDIETRPGYQRQGYAKKLMELVSDKLGKPLALSGSLTPEGWAAFQGKLPILPGYPVPSGPSYRSMTFVEDWDKRYAPS